MPTYPSWMQAWLQATSTADASLMLVTINHPQWGTRRFVRNPVDFVSRDQTYSKAWFEIIIVTDSDRPPEARFSIPNVYRQIGIELMALRGQPAELAIELISSAYPDEPYYRAARLQMSGFKITAIDVSGKLSVRSYAQEPFGKIVMTPARAPGLFQIRQ